MVSIYFCKESKSLKQRIIIIRILTLSMKGYLFDSLLGISNPIILRKSCLFSPLNFRVVSISSSMSYSLSIDLLLISVNILEASLKCISIFFFLSCMTPCRRLKPLSKTTPSTVSHPPLMLLWRPSFAFCPLCIHCYCYCYKAKETTLRKARA